MRINGDISERFGSLRLEPGAHESPRDGVCVMELASLLADEEFSDSPECVCPVIASFMRGWNDRLGYSDRQRLLPYAARVVGTSGDREATRRRRQICLEWIGAHDPGERLALRARIAMLLGAGQALDLDRGAPEYAARLCFASDDPDAAFDLLDRLLDVGAPPSLQLEPYDLDKAPVNGNGNGAHTNGNGHTNGDGRAPAPSKTKA